MRLGVEADGAHEGERLGDPVGQFLVALGQGAVLDEAQHPAMDVLEIGVAAGGEGAQKVERRSGLAIGVQLPARIGLARRRRELDVVDNVAAIGRQSDAVDRLDVGRARLRELPGDATDLHDGRRGGEGHDHRHLQEHPEEIADVVGRMFAEALGAISALQQERIARGRLPESFLELARFTRKNQRRITGKLALGLGQRRTIGIGRRLRDRFRAPAIRGPTLVQHDPWPWRAAERRFLKVNRPIYSPTLKANMPIFEAARIYRTGRGWKVSRASLRRETLGRNKAACRPSTKPNRAPPGPKVAWNRHCEERSDEAIQRTWTPYVPLDCTF